MTIPIIYEDLSRNEIDFLVTNNCGGRILDVPDFSFELACTVHDVLYWIGNTAEDRKAADLRMYYDMHKIVDDMPWYRRAYMRPLVYIYYAGVRTGGHFIGFNWGRKRYYEDLVYAMTLADHSENLPEGWDAI